MNVRYVSRDLLWTEPMREHVRVKLAEPLRNHLNTDDFELSVHIDHERKPAVGHSQGLEIWVVLQTFDGCGNQIVRCRGHDFAHVLNEASVLLREGASRPTVALRLSTEVNRFMHILFRPQAI